MTGASCSRQLPSHPSPLRPHLGVLAALIVPAAVGPWLPATAQPRNCKPVPVTSTRTLPPYPSTSLELGEQGTTELEITVARNGHVSGARVIRSSGFPRLDEAAARHVRQNYLWQPMACASARTHLRVVWDPDSHCALTKSCKPSRN